MVRPALTRTRLGIYCPGTGTGGPWRYVHSILAGLDPAEFAVTVFSDLPAGYPGRPDVATVPLSGPSVPLPSPVPAPAPARRRRLPRPVALCAGFARQSQTLAALLRRHPVDVFHTQNTGYEESPVAAKLAGVRRVVGTFHVDPSYDLENRRGTPAHRLIETVSNRCLDVGIGVSEAAGRAWRRRTPMPAGRVVAIPNGIDPDRFRRRTPAADAKRALGLPADARVVGGVGRLDPAKGFADLLAAAAVLRTAFPALHVVIAGDGPLRKELEAKAATLGVADRVRFLGFVGDVQGVLDALDVFALPSLCETLGYAFLEAMATGLPAVGTRVGGVPEVIAHGTTGFLVPPRSPDHLAAAIAELLRSLDLRSRMGDAGRARVAERFHERDMVRRTVAVYRGGGRGDGD